MKLAIAVGMVAMFVVGFGAGQQHARLEWADTVREALRTVDEWRDVAKRWEAVAVKNQETIGVCLRTSGTWRDLYFRCSGTEKQKGPEERPPDGRFSLTGGHEYAITFHRSRAN